MVEINWGAVGAIAAVLTIPVAVWGIRVSRSPKKTIINSPTDLPDPPVLTAKIESFPFRHAATKESAYEEEWREEWLHPLEGKLKERGIAPDLLETMVATMEHIFQRKEAQSGIFNIEHSRKWFRVTIRNNGDKPLKDVFLKFPAAAFWLDERDRLSVAPKRIEIGDMDQKSEKIFTFWDRFLGPLPEKDGVVLGHSDGLGTIEFE